MQRSKTSKPRTSSESKNTSSSKKSRRKSRRSRSANPKGASPSKASLSSDPAGSGSSAADVSAPGAPAVSSVSDFAKEVMKIFLWILPTLTYGFCRILPPSQPGQKTGRIPLSSKKKNPCPFRRMIPPATANKKRLICLSLNLRMTQLKHMSADRYLNPGNLHPAALRMFPEILIRAISNILPMISWKRLYRITKMIRRLIPRTGFQITPCGKDLIQQRQLSQAGMPASPPGEGLMQRRQLLKTDMPASPPGEDPIQRQQLPKPVLPVSPPGEGLIQWRLPLLSLTVLPQPAMTLSPAGRAQSPGLQIPIRLPPL